jgi:hypothetical protein
MNPAIILPSAGIYCLNMAISEKNLQKSGDHFLATLEQSFSQESFE